MNLYREEEGTNTVSACDAAQHTAGVPYTFQLPSEAYVQCTVPKHINPLCLFEPSSKNTMHDKIF